MVGRLHSRSILVSTGKLSSIDVRKKHLLTGSDNVWAPRKRVGHGKR